MDTFIESQDVELLREKLMCLSSLAAQLLFIERELMAGRISEDEAALLSENMRNLDSKIRDRASYIKTVPPPPVSFISQPAVEEDLEFLPDEDVLSEDATGGAGSVLPPYIISEIQMLVWQNTPRSTIIDPTWPPFREEETA